MVTFSNEQNQSILLSTKNYEFPNSNDKEYEKFPERSRHQN